MTMLDIPFKTIIKPTVRPKGTHSHLLDIPFKTMIKPTVFLCHVFQVLVGYTIQNNNKTNSLF